MAIWSSGPPGGGGGGGSAITVEDEGVPLTTNVTKFNFTGPGVTVTESVADEVEVAVSGVLANHVTTHEDGGADEINVAGLSGVLADAQTPTVHAASHEDGGADEINVAGLSGLLADAQTPTVHAASHEDGGSDEITAQNLGSGAAPSGQVMETDGAGGWNLIATPSGGGGSSVPDPFMGVWEAESGFTVVSGKFYPVSGTLGTPSGITQFGVNLTDLDGTDTTSILSSLGANNFIRIWKEDLSDWFLYQVTGSTISAPLALFNVSFIADLSGGSITALEDCRFTLLTGTANTIESLRYTGLATLPNNITNWVTVPLVGINGTAFNRDIGATVNTGLTFDWLPHHITRAGVVLPAQKVRFRATDGSGGSLNVEFWRQTKTAGGSGVTNTQMAAPSIAVPSGQITELSIPSFTVNALAEDDYIGMVLKRADANAPLNVYVDYALRFAQTG